MFKMVYVVYYPEDKPPALRGIEKSKFDAGVDPQVGFAYNTKWKKSKVVSVVVKIYTGKCCIKILL